MEIKILNIKMALAEVPKEKSEKDYVAWGEKNSYPNYLFDLYQQSPKHSAIINNKQLYISGQSDNQEVINQYGETVSDVWQMIVREYLIFGMAALWVKVISGRVASMRVLPVINVRIDGGFKHVCFGNFSKSISLFKYSRNTDAAYTVFPIASRLSEGENVYLFGDWYGNNVYPTPNYASALRYIYLDYQISNFWQSYLSNGLTAGYMVNIFSANPTDKEKEDIEERFNQLFSGDDNGGKIIYSFPHDADRKTTIEPIDSADFVTKYQQLNKTCQEEIFVSHNITSPMLFGIRTEGQLGGRNELEMAFKIYYNTQIKTIRSRILRWFKNFVPSFNVGDVTPIEPEQQPAVMVTKSVDKSDDEIKEEVLRQVEGVETEQYDSEIGVKPVSVISPSNEYKLMSEHESIKMFEGVGFLLTKYDVMALQILNASPNTKKEFMAYALGLDNEAMDALIDKLIRKGFIIEIDGGYAITNKGKSYLKDEKVTFTDVRYSYDWKEGFGDKDRKNSRDFCQRMMKESARRRQEKRLWSRGDIEKVSQQVGWDVWKMRGGWYRIPGTEISVPNCRHEWKQHIVIVQKVL